MVHLQTRPCLGHSWCACKITGDGQQRWTPPNEPRLLQGVTSVAAYVLPAGHMGRPLGAVASVDSSAALRHVFGINRRDAHILTAPTSSSGVFMRLLNCGRRWAASCVVFTEAALHHSARTRASVPVSGDSRSVLSSMLRGVLALAPPNCVKLNAR